VQLVAKKPLQLENNDKKKVGKFVTIFFGNKKKKIEKKTELVLGKGVQHGNIEVKFS